VVISSLAQGRSALAVGNIIGSAISNILGAFSLGLLFYGSQEPIQFDRSARVYCLILLVITTLVVPAAYLSNGLVWQICGALLIALFVVYLVSVGWAISRSILAAPEDSDDEDSDGDSDSESARTSVNGETDPLLQSSDGLPASESETPMTAHRPIRCLGYHVLHLVFGFLATCLAGYLLSHAAINIISTTGMSDALFGVIILAIATTLPEKFVAVMSGNRGQAGILVANTVGSNIFLLSLCLGIVMLCAVSGEIGKGIGVPELAFLWGSTLALAAAAWFGERFSRLIGAAMVIAYTVFIVLEFFVFDSSYAS
jgi:Ca2+/Na+ antiporter